MTSGTRPWSVRQNLFAMVSYSIENFNSRLFVRWRCIEEESTFNGKSVNRSITGFYCKKEHAKRDCKALRNKRGIDKWQSTGQQDMRCEHN